MSTATDVHGIGANVPWRPGAFPPLTGNGWIASEGGQQIPIEIQTLGVQPVTLAPGDTATDQDVIPSSVGRRRGDIKAHEDAKGECR